MSMTFLVMWMEVITLTGLQRVPQYIPMPSMETCKEMEKAMFAHAVTGTNVEYVDEIEFFTKDEPEVIEEWINGTYVVTKCETINANSVLPSMN